MNKRLVVIATSAVFVLSACGAQSALPQSTGLVVAPGAGGATTAAPVATASPSVPDVDAAKAMKDAAAKVRPGVTTWTADLAVCPPTTKIKRFTCKIALDKMATLGKSGLTALPAEVPAEMSADVAALRKVLTTMSTTTAKSTGCSAEFDRSAWGTACASYVKTAQAASKDLTALLAKL